MSNASRPPGDPSRAPRSTLPTIAIIAAVVVAVIVGFVAIGSLVGNDSGTKAATGFGGSPTVTTPVTSPTPTVPSVTVTTPTQSLPPLHCLPPPPKPTKPQQFKKAPDPSLAQNATWQATVQTNCGPIVIDLEGKAAPQTVASFIFLSQKKFYDDVPCHRLVTSGIYVLQCGDPTGSGSGGPGYQYKLENAPPNGDYPPGTVAMARTNEPNTNGSQFFICYSDTKLPAPGYSIFGKVVKGLDIVSAIAARGIGPDGVAPAQPISMLSISLKKL